MNHQVVTVADVVVDASRESELIDGFRSLSDDDVPEGLVRSELLRGQEGAWRIQTTWQDRDALVAVRRSGKPPAALELLDRLAVDHSHAWFTVEETYEVR